MKKLLSILMIALMAISMTFVACKKDDPDNPGSGGGSSYVIEAKDIRFADGAGIANVKGYMTSASLATAKFSNNGFKLSAPKTVQDKYLTDNWEGPVMGELELIATDGQNNEIGQCYKFGGSEGNTYWAGWYYYVKAAYSDEDITLKKGWNEIFWICDWNTDQLLEVATKEPAGTFWVFDDGSKKSNQKAIFQKLQNLNEAKTLNFKF
jgi:hypothetical protein